MARSLPHHGRWFEDLHSGDVIPHALTRTVTETDNVLITTLTLNPARLHLDHEYAAEETEFGLRARYFQSDDLSIKES